MSLGLEQQKRQELEEAYKAQMRQLSANDQQPGVVKQVEQKIVTFSHFVTPQSQPVGPRTSRKVTVTQTQTIVQETTQIVDKKEDKEEEAKQPEEGRTGPGRRHNRNLPPGFHDRLDTVRRNPQRAPTFRMEGFQAP